MLPGNGQKVLGGGGGWVVCKPVLVFSFDFGKAEHFLDLKILLKVVELLDQNFQ